VKLPFTSFSAVASRQPLPAAVVGKKFQGVENDAEKILTADYADERGLGNGKGVLSQSTPGTEVLNHAESVAINNFAKQNSDGETVQYTNHTKTGSIF
jgi:hypothetical protein